MADEDSERTKAPSAAGGRQLAGLLAKALIFLFVLNAAVLPFDSVAALGHVSLYNSLVPGRLRLPYADDPARAYNVSVTQLDALFRSHVLSDVRPKAAELRVVVLGDSSVWGFHLGPRETLAAQLDRLRLTVGGRKLSFYNVGYPTMSLLKDLVLLRRALEYRPDVIVWLVTLESFPVELQGASPLVRFNRTEAQAALTQSGIDPSRYLPPGEDAPWWANTWVGRRRELAELFRLQIYGLMWAATGIDYDAEAPFTLRAENLEADPAFHGRQAGQLSESDLAWELLDAGVRDADAIPVLIVNEPMFLSRGENSDLRYNFLYPRWAYDAFRGWWALRCRSQRWRCVDVWDSLPAESFTDSAVHYNPKGAQRLADLLAEPIRAAAASISVP